MVMQSDGRVLTVEEAKKLPPSSHDVLEQRRRALAALRAIGDHAVQRLGRELSEDEFHEIFGHPESDDEYLDHSQAATAPQPDSANSG